MKPRRATSAVRACSVACVLLASQASASGSPAVSTDPRDILTVDERVGWDMNYPLRYGPTERSRFLADFFRGATAQSVEPFLGSRQLLQHAARYTDNAEVVAFLVESGYDPNKGFGPGIPDYPQSAGEREAIYDGDMLVLAGSETRREGPLHFAARYNPDPRIVEALARAGADVQARGGFRLNTPLQYAARYNNAAVVSALLREGARVDDVNGRIEVTHHRGPNINGNTALHEAGANEDASVVDVLVDAGADVDRMNSSGLTPLHFAAVNGRAATFAALVRRGADPNARVGSADSEDETHDCEGCGAFGLLAGALEDRVDGAGRHALDDADLKQAEHLLQALVGVGADVGAAGGALDLAVRAELGPRLAALLIDAGVAPTPSLWEAVFAPAFQYTGQYAGGRRNRAVGSQGNLRVLDLLIGKGLDARAADSCGRTPLHLATSLAHGKENGGLVQAVEKLVAAGADVNARTVEAGASHCEHFGATPLHVEAGAGALDVASALIDAGADMEAKDAEGRLPLDVAAAAGHLDLVQLLLRRSLFTSVPALFRNRDVAGSFTAVDANERLLVEAASGRYQLVSLVDEGGAATPVVALDRRHEYEGLCFDDETRTHTAVFARSDSAERAYYHYDADAGTLAEVFVEGDALPAPRRWPGACRWREAREWQRGLEAYERALGALAPPSDDLVAGDAPKVLPARVVPAAVAESELATLRSLPSVRVEDVDLEWRRWKLVVVRYADAHSPWRGMPGHEHGHGCGGLLLAWDGTRREWRSFFRCATVVDIDAEPFSEGTLLLEHHRGDKCGPQREWPCVLRLDLTTWEAQLYENPRDHLAEDRFEAVPRGAAAENDAEQ